MTKEDLKNIVQDTINAAAAGSMPAYAAITLLLDKFNEALEPFIKSRKHLQLFIYRVHSMRELQQQYFNGKKSVLPQAKKNEQMVDNAMKKLTGELGYTIEDIKKQYEQQELKM